MRLFLIIFFLSCCSVQAQDKLFFKNGSSRTGILVTNARDYVYFKVSDTAQVEKIKKSQLLLMEDYKGNRYLFSEEEKRSDSLRLSPSKAGLKRNILSVQPMAFLFGRANFSYERLSKDGKVGFVIPIILTYDPSFGNIFNGLDSNYQRIKGLNYITGLDINLYFGKKDAVKFFLGPRIRYGTDIAFLNIEGYSIQTQFGMMVGGSAAKVVQHLSLGFGFVRIISSSISLLAAPKQSLTWFSLNYRLGIKW